MASGKTDVSCGSGFGPGNHGLAGHGGWRDKGALSLGRGNKRKTCVVRASRQGPSTFAVEPLMVGRYIEESEKGGGGKEKRGKRMSESGEAINRKEGA